MRIAYSFILIIALFLSQSTYAQKVDEIVNKYIAFTGGKKQWEKVKTITATGEYDYGGMKFPFNSYAKSPDRYKFSVAANGKYYAQAFDGTRGWKIDVFNGETNATILTGKDARAMANEADVETESVLIDYRKKGPHAILEGADTVQGRNCFRVKFIHKEGYTALYYFDRITSELFMKTSESKNAEMKGTLLHTIYSDYRDVNGLKFPFKIISKANDQAILTVTFERIELNKAIDDAEFQP